MGVVGEQAQLLADEALLRSIAEAGFDLVFEQFDVLGNTLSNGTSNTVMANHRGTFVGIRTAGR